MSAEAGTQGTYRLWINWAEQIVSFRKVEAQAFEVLEFHSNEERFAYVFDHCATGFRIQ